MFKWILPVLLCMSFNAKAQSRTNPFLKKILSHPGKTLLDSVINDPTRFRCQVIYTRINRGKDNVPHFRNFYFNYDPQLYFNPASMVKMPLAFLSLEKLNILNKASVDKYTSMRFDSSYPGQKALLEDSTSVNGLPSIAHFIKRAFLISENDPYNRMYQFVGQQQINSSLHVKGYKDVRITRQFAGFSPEANRHTNAIDSLTAQARLSIASHQLTIQILLT